MCQVYLILSKYINSEKECSMKKPTNNVIVKFMSEMNIYELIAEMLVKKTAINSLEEVISKPMFEGCEN